MLSHWDKLKTAALCALLALTLASPTAAQTGATRRRPRSVDSAPSFVPGMVRLKDVAYIHGARGNQLSGYGLVVGLEGTGDGSSSYFTVQSIVNMLKKNGLTLNVPTSQLSVKNVAAVWVTAELPAFARKGSKIDVTVSSLGDAKSLQGGMLLQTPLKAGNGGVYAAAQGPVSIGGFNVSSGGSTSQRNFTNVGRVPGGAFVEEEVPAALTDGATLQLVLRDPDFTTASRVADALRRQSLSAIAEDSGSISVAVPKAKQDDVVSFIASIEMIGVLPDQPARIIINERTGTVVVTGAVRLGPGAIAHGGLSIRIDNNPVIIPPAPFNPNPAVVVPLQNVDVQEKKVNFAPIPATTTIQELANALNRLGVTPRDLIAILQAMQQAGMLNAQLEAI